jgi:helicase
LTEEEVAIRLLKGDMEEIAPVYEIEEMSEEFAANSIICHGQEADIIRIDEMMVGHGEDPIPELLRHKLVHKNGNVLELSPLGRVMAEQFIGMKRLLEIDRLVRMMDDPLELIAEIECSKEECDKERRCIDRVSSKKDDGSWITNKKSSSAAPLSDKNSSNDTPIWTDKRKPATNATERKHQKDRDSSSNKFKSERKSRHKHGEDTSETKMLCRVNKKLENEIKRKNRKTTSFIPTVK